MQTAIPEKWRFLRTKQSRKDAGFRYKNSIRQLSACRTRNPSQDSHVYDINSKSRCWSFPIKYTPVQLFVASGGPQNASNELANELNLIVALVSVCLPECHIQHSEPNNGLSELYRCLAFRELRTTMRIDMTKCQNPHLSYLARHRLAHL